MRPLVVLIVTILALSFASLTVNACSCPASGAPCEAYGSADAVFIGTVVGVREELTPEESDATGRFRNPRGFKFAVEHSYFGVSGPETEVFTSSTAADCGYEFKIGKRYLVYAYRQPPKLTTHSCSRTNQLSRADEDLMFLNTLSSVSPGVTIYGTIRGRNVENKSLYSDILIAIEGESTRKEVHPDAEGDFRVSELPAGKYKLRLQLPEMLISNWPLESEIQVSDHGCAAVGWDVKDNGRINGRVVNADGEAINNITVTLLEPGTDFARFFIQSGSTDKEGNFSLTGVPRGRYLIAVNYNHYPQLGDPNSAYTPTFYPGVIDEANAQVVIIGAGEKLEKLDIRVPVKRPESILEGSVVWSDGSAVTDARLIVMDETIAEFTVPDEVRPDSQGKFIIKGFAGQKLVIEACSNGEKATDPVEPVRITLQQPSETMRIVIPKPR